MAVGIWVATHIWVDMIPQQVMWAHECHPLHETGGDLLRGEISEMTARDSRFCYLVLVLGDAWQLETR